MLVDSSANEFPLGDSRDKSQLFIGRDCVSLSLVLDRFEIQQTEVFALLPVFVGFLSYEKRRPVREDLGALQKTASESGDDVAEPSS